MALPLGKLTILIGAGVVGSILAKEGRIPGFSDVLSGALKIALKPLQQNDSAPAASKPRNDALIAQVNSLRQELQLLASNKSVTIVTSSRTAGRQFGVIILIVVIGTGYVWWKGWKLPDCMFATKRSLKDACDSVANQLTNVYHSVEVNKKSLSSKIDKSSCTFEEIVEYTATTRDEVAGVSGPITKFSEDVQYMNNKILTLDQKLGKIQMAQDETLDGVGDLLCKTLDEDNRLNERIQDTPPNASRPALEHPRFAVSLRTVSLPASLSLDLPSPSTSNGSNEINGRGRDTVSVVENASSPRLPNGSNVTPEPVRSARLLSRAISATRNFM